jgi:hypothetical protein
MDGQGPDAPERLAYASIVRAVRPHRLSLMRPTPDLVAASPCIVLHGDARCQSARSAIVRRQAKPRLIPARRGDIVAPCRRVDGEEPCDERVWIAIHRGIDRGSADARRRLAELDAKIERAVELAIETGGMEAVKRKLASLRAEREQLVGRLRVAPQPRSVEALRDLVVRRVMDFREAFGGAPEDCRRALRALLDGDRMRVYADGERTFRIEGLFRLAALESGKPPGASSERFTCRVAGGCYARGSPRCRFRCRCRSRDGSSFARPESSHRSPGRVASSAGAAGGRRPRAR